MQYSLFPEENMSSKEADLPIKMDDLQGMEAVKIVLNSRKKASIIALANGVYMSLKHFRYVSCDKNGELYEPNAISRMRQENPLKNDWANFLAIFMVPDNFAYILRFMSNIMCNLVLAVAENHYLSVNKANKIWGNKCVVSSYWYSELIDELSVFFSLENASHYSYDAEGQYIVFSNQKIYELILKMQINEEPKCNDMPNDLLIFNAEKDIFTDLPIMDSLFLADKLKVGKTKLRTVSLKKNLENLKIREFLDSNVLGEEYTKLRAENLALIYAVFSQWKGGEDFIDLSCLDKIHTLSLNLLQLGDEFIALFLPHISGASKSVCNSYTVSLFLNLIAESMDKLSDKEWISVNLFSKQLRYWGLNSVGVDLFCLIKPSSYRTKLSNNWTSKAINFDDILPQITLPAIKSIFFLLASWGMVEIAYQSPNGSNTVSPFDGVEYVRLTALGRFAFGIDSEYTPPVVVESVKDFELSGDRLLIKFLDADSPRRAVFSQFAKAVTPVLYSVDFSSFLEGCTIRNEVESKIKKFRNIVKENLPEVWETFFAELLNRCDPLLKVKTSYVVRRINSNDKRLQEIILTDKELKKYIVRAENYIILMEQKNMDKVSHILRGYGYLI